MRTTRSAWAIAVLALVGLVLSLTAVWPRSDRPRPVPDREAGPPAVSTTRAPASSGAPSEVGRNDAAPGPARPSVVPVGVAMTSIGVEAPVRPVGVARDGQMQLPPDPRVMGWYRFGPAPASGEAGSVVVAGHLDSKRFGIGPLVRLRDIEVGEPVAVALSDGTTSTYTVVEVERFDRQALPSRLFARTGPERLRIITCGGAYDPVAGGYQQNLVVTAAPA